MWFAQHFEFPCAIHINKQPHWSAHILDLPVVVVIEIHIILRVSPISSERGGLS